MSSIPRRHFRESKDFDVFKRDRICCESKTGAGADAEDGALRDMPRAEYE